MQMTQWRLHGIEALKEKQANAKLEKDASTECLQQYEH